VHDPDTPVLDLRAVADVVGTPAYVFDPEVFRADLRAVRVAAAAFRGRVQLAYSLKTNYLPALLDLVREAAMPVDVVSEYEYDWARHHGFGGSSIVVNGPHKPDRLLERALQDGAFINVETIDEVLAVGRCCSVLGIARAGIGVRVGSTTDPYTGRARAPLSKFGAPVGSPYLDRLLQAVDAEPRLVLRGFHCHLGSQMVSAESYHAAIRPVLRWAASARARHPIDRVNLGGGIGVEGISRVPTAAADPSRPTIGTTGFQHREPDLNAWFSGIDALWAEEGLGGCELVVEPGRAVASRCMSLLAEVSSVKEFLDEPIVTLDAGVNLLPTAGPAEAHRIEFPDHPSGASRPARVVGPLCYEGDVFGFGVQVPASVRRGDLALVRDAGAYGLTRATSFNQLRAPVARVADGRTEVVWRRERVEDLLRFPITVPSTGD